MTVEERASSLTQEQVVSLLVRVDDLVGQVGNLEQQLSWFKRQLFGEKSEKGVAAEDPRQLMLGELLQQEAGKAPSPKQKVSGYERGKAKKKKLEGSPEDTGLRFGPEVPVEVIKVPNPELEGLSAGDYEVVDTRYTYRLAQRPGSYVVLKYEREVIKLKEGEAPSTPPAPPAVLLRSYADVSFLAGLYIDKFLYHIPLNRQHQRLRDSGIVLSRATLTSLLQRATALLVPIYEAQYASVLESLLLAMDEIPMKAGLRAKGKMNKSYFWPIYGDKDELVFPWRRSRAHSHVGELLEGFSGILLTDGYAAYKRYAEKAEGVIQAQCWSHTRRKFEQALEREPVPAGEALDRIRKLYGHEKHIREQGLEEEKKLLYRVEHSKPEVEQFFAWLGEMLQAQALLPSNPFTKAANYALDREEELTVFLRFPEVQIDTNHNERELRPIALGRRNWLFCSTELGARDVGVIQSLLRTCILQRVNPWHYLVDVLQRIREHPPDQVALLTPRLWKQHFADCRVKAPLECLERSG